MLPGPTPTSVPSGILIDPEIWPQQKWAKIGGCALFFWGGGAGSQSDTMSPGPSPTSTPRGIMINSTVWPPPQYIKVTDRQTGQRSHSVGRTVFGRPFVKQFALSYWTVVCPVCLWRWRIVPNGWMDQDETWHAGRPRPRPHCLRWGHSSPSPKNGAQPLPQFSVHVYCGQTAGWIKMPLGMEIGVGAGHIVLDGYPAPKKGHSPQFTAHVCCRQTVTHLSYCWALIQMVA